MKRVFVFAFLCLLGTAPLMRGQTPLPPLAPPTAPSAATPAPMSQQEIDQNYKSLKGEVADLKEANADWRKRFEEIRRELSTLREQMDKPNATYATKDDLKRLADAVQEVDRKREEDTKRILDEFAKLGKIVSTPPSTGRGSTRTPDPVPVTPANRGDESGVTYTVKPNDSLASIAAAYREQGKQQGIKVTVTWDQIAKANPKVKPNDLQVGTKLFIPLGKPADAK